LYQERLADKADNLQSAWLAPPPICPITDIHVSSLSPPPLLAPIRESYHILAELQRNTLEGSRLVTEELEKERREMEGGISERRYTLPAKVMSPSPELLSSSFSEV